MADLGGKLCVVVMADSITQMQQKINTAVNVDMIECRLDYLPVAELAQVPMLQASTNAPLLFTLRSQQEGGRVEMPESERIEALKKLMLLQPAYVDVEHHVPLEVITALQALSPNTQLIISKHHLKHTPEDLQQALLAMPQVSNAIYKLVTFAQSTLDSLRMLSFVKQHSGDRRMTGFCMGEHGVPSRVLGKVVGNQIHYAAMNADAASAPGQLSLQELESIYRFSQLNADTAIYGLLGSPVSQSPGHVFHNNEFKVRDRNAVYLRFQVEPEELLEFFKFKTQLNLRGFSVTMPLKVAVIECLDELTLLAKKIGAVNTVKIGADGRCVGTNTDAMGALHAIEEVTSVANKQVVIVGAGGAAKAIAYALIQHGARVLLVARNLEKAQPLAAELQCDLQALGAFCDAEKLSYDILVNTTPVGMKEDALPIPERCILANSVVMDIIYQPRQTPLLQVAQYKECRCIYGEAMYRHQAQLQQSEWLPRQ